MTTQPVREAADAWEGVARAVGVASAAVKTQMLVLLQEVQSRQDMSDTIRRQEISRVRIEGEIEKKWGKDKERE